MTTKSFTQRNPATGEEGRSFPALDAEGIETRLARAEAAFARWRTTPVDERTGLLQSLAHTVERQADTLAATMTFEMGKTLASARAEVEKCAAAFRYYAETGPALLEPVDYDLGDGKRARGEWQPLGPVLAIMPWNFPLWQVVRFMAPAILAGNVGLLKHASNVPGTAQALEDLVRDAGGPEGLFQTLHVGSDAIGDVIDDSRVVAVTLTGSEGAGIKVAERAGRNLKKVVLELGGSDPFVVMPSADLDEAVKQGVKARVQNAGQSCICAKRMIVHKDVYPAFRDRFVEAMTAVVVGDPMDDGSAMGPLVDAKAVETIEDQVARAVADGATLHGGGRMERGDAWYRPGVLEKVEVGSAMSREELFGPVAMLFEAADLDDAIRIANDVPFGLGASIWTNDADEQARLIRDLECGMVAVNAMLASDPRAPFGGVKRSGHGRELAAAGLREFMNLKTVML